uniref:Uncharacterized protein n=1 Tax=Anguilla anguilla TaxID=7936 RepID=A0A0E9SEZ2_ANGAN
MTHLLPLVAAVWYCKA